LVDGKGGKVELQGKRERKKWKFVCVVEGKKGKLHGDLLERKETVLAQSSEKNHGLIGSRNPREPGARKRAAEKVRAREMAIKRKVMGSRRKNPSEGEKGKRKEGNILRKFFSDK